MTQMYKFTLFSYPLHSLVLTVNLTQCRVTWIEFEWRIIKIRLAWGVCLWGTVLLSINWGGKNPAYWGLAPFPKERLLNSIPAVFCFSHGKCIKTAVCQFSSGLERHGHSVQGTGNNHFQPVDSSLESLDSPCDESALYHRAKAWQKTVRVMSTRHRRPHAVALLDGRWGNYLSQDTATNSNIAKKFNSMSS